MTPEQRARMEAVTVYAVTIPLLALAAAFALIVLALGYRCAAALAGWD